MKNNNSKYLKYLTNGLQGVVSLIVACDEVDEMRGNINVQIERLQQFLRKETKAITATTEKKPCKTCGKGKASSPEFLKRVAEMRKRKMEKKQEET